MFIERKIKKIIKLFIEYKNKPREETLHTVYDHNVANRDRFIEFILFQTNFLKKENVKRAKKIKEILESSVDRGCFESKKLELNGTFLETILILKPKGREFLNFFVYWNTVLKNYGDLIKFILALILSGVFWVFIKNILNWIF